MPKRKGTNSGRTSKSGGGESSIDPPPTNGGNGEVLPPRTTGRYLVLLKKGAGAASLKTLQDTAGLSVASSADFENETMSVEELGGADALFFDELGVAVVDAAPDQIQSLGVAAGEGGDVLAIEPEQIMYAVQEGRSPVLTGAMPGIGSVIGAESEARFSTDYLRGFRDAVNELTEKLLGDGEAADAGLPRVAAEHELTWGLQVTNVAASRFTGRGIRVAVLDTGLDLGHPDFVGRRITSQSFIANQPVQDGNGHGTHCIGTACGPRQPNRLPRYGVAYEADIFAGKVLSNQGSGADGGILAGINWAIANGCQVISMSLGSRVFPGQGFDPIYEQVAQRALTAGTLIIAAAGNNSSRPSFISPVGRPANCPSIMAVGALDSRLRVAPFSCGGLNSQGGQVDIAGPGVAILSSWPRPTLYNTISGTSMATPHVAGIAALLAESDSSLRGRALWAALIQHARRLTLPARDVGSGLVQAP